MPPTLDPADPGPQRRRAPRRQPRAEGAAEPTITAPRFRLSAAARLLGVSDDTVRRWADAGRLVTTLDATGRRVVDGRELAAFASQLAGSPPPGRTVAESARNHFPGLVTRVLRDAVMAQVEMQAGPYRIVSLLSREAADELHLEPGVLAVASVKSTNVVIGVPEVREGETR